MLFFCLLSFNLNSVWAQQITSEAPSPVALSNGVTINNTFMESADFKTWLLADTNTRITNVGILLLVVIVVVCILFLGSCYLWWRCCRQKTAAFRFFAGSKPINTNNYGRFGMFFYDFRKERIRTSGIVCSLFNLEDCCALPVDAYLRMIHQGQNVTAGEQGKNSELIYERDTGTVFISLYTIPIMDKNGALRGEYGLLQDVSFIRNREMGYLRRLESARKTFDSIDAYIMSNPMHAMVLHDNFDILRMNKAAMDVVGTDDDEFNSLCFKLLLANSDMIKAFAGHLDQAAEAGFAKGTFKLFNHEQQLVHVEIYTSKIISIDYGDILCSSFQAAG